MSSAHSGRFNDVDQSEIDEFVEYVRSFYADGNLWVDDDGPPPTDAEMIAATNLIIEHYGMIDDCHPLGPRSDIELSSHCREVARDIILTWRGYQGRTWPEQIPRQSTHLLEHGDLVDRMLSARGRDGNDHVH